MYWLTNMIYRAITSITQDNTTRPSYQNCKNDGRPRKIPIGLHSLIIKVSYYEPIQTLKEAHSL